MAEIDFSKNIISVVPEFIQCWPTLQMFKLDDCNINDIGCIDWILNNSQTIDFGELVQKAKKMKFKIIRTNMVSLVS